ncbi:MAG TPA: TrkA C-terminal domain-containing protein [Desulfosporosinus sp.]|nr:TrkA C-terminal domain-containing protein [Desulfosporosinus sp.]
MDQARYQEIAIDIAHAIMMGEYHEGVRIHGRSTLAGRYNVSPETIRRAIAILQNVGVVEVSQGIGITVTSKDMAERFIKSLDQKGEIQGFLEDLKSLMDIRRENDIKIESHLDKLQGYADRIMSRWLDVGEIKIGKTSPAIGKTLKELQVRECTGTTVVAVVRDGFEQFSPEAAFVLRAEDVLLAAGSNKGQEKLQQFDPFPINQTPKS